MRALLHFIESVSAADGLDYFFFLDLGRRRFAIAFAGFVRRCIAAEFVAGLGGLMLGRRRVLIVRWSVIVAIIGCRISLQRGRITVVRILGVFGDRQIWMFDL